MFLISFSHNNKYITTDRCNDYATLITNTVEATGGELQSTDIDSFEYCRKFGDSLNTITVKNSKGLDRIPNEDWYRLKCITTLPKCKSDKSSPIINKNASIAQTSSIDMQDTRDTKIKIQYKLDSNNKKKDSMSSNLLHICLLHIEISSKNI